MAPWHRKAAFIWAVLSFLLYIGFTKAQDPQKSITYFDSLPGRLFFFEDTTSVVYYDIQAGNVHISQDEGKNWAIATDIPKGAAAAVIEHPSDSRYAFVLTTGTKHYRTDDRGRTWHSFDVPAKTSYVARPLSFHSDPAKWGHILYQGTVCSPWGWGETCHDETYYTTDGFESTPKLLLKETSRCQYAHSTKEFKHDADDNLIYCVAFDSTSQTGTHTLSSSRLFSSTDYFQTKQIEDLGIGKDAKGVLAFAIVSKFAVVALKDLSPGSDGDMLLYVTVNTKEWAKAQFPHASQARLRENAYTIVESTIHSLAVDVKLQDQSTIGTLFVSNSNGTFFVESLKDTNRNAMGFVDYENLYGVEGVGIANVVANAQDVERKKAPKQLKSMITFDDGSSWAPLRAPSTDVDGKRVACDPSDVAECSLHLHSVTNPHNFGRIFSSPAPGFVMGVGSIGKSLAPYEDCDTFLSDDAGLTWKMIRRDAHQYEFGDSGSVLVIVNDETEVNHVRYSTDMGKTWKSYDLGITVRAKALTTVSDSTSQKFILLAQVSRQDHKQGDGRYGVIFLDFAETRTRKCGESDLERWYARSAQGRECLMGRKQYYMRRKEDANCYVGDKFHDPVIHEESCPCEDHDFECDYNYVRSGDKCISSGRERIPNSMCTSGKPDESYMGSSGYRLIPGNQCDRGRGVRKDEPISKKCSEAEPAEGEVVHQTFEFPAQVVQHDFFKDSSTILVRLADNTIWQSSNEGYSWEQQYAGERFLAFYMHTHSNERAYLITDSAKFYYTTDTGRHWYEQQAPTPPNSFHAQVLHFQPRTDYLIWTGNAGCDGAGEKCRAEAQYTWDNGRHWKIVEDYVVNCDWARDDELKIDSSQILCESYLTKQGSQRYFGKENNALQLVSGTDYFERKTKLFDNVVGFTKFSEFLIVAEYLPQRNSLDLQVSLDGRTFAAGMFPPGMHPDTHAYTVLESSTMAIFLHMTMTDWPSPHWGNILKSNSNGTYFGLSIENVNRNELGYVDFEKFIGLDGIAMVNVVANPAEAAITGRKVLQTRITHNDGGSWRPLSPPAQDSLGNKYPCTSTSCALHVHGYTERIDARATYSSPSVVGVVMAVGNVGEVLAPYTQSDTFLSRDGGFTWEEVHKDAHLWEFGDSGSVIVLVNDEEPTDHVLFTTDEGLSWREYKFSNEKMRISSIVTVPEDTSRKFMLLGKAPRSSGSVIVHLDFSSLTHRQCQVSIEEPGHDDFELWSPSEERNEICLFGRQTIYHRRARDHNCVVGKLQKLEDKIVRNCQCSNEDFECEFNYVKNANGECVLVPGMSPLPDDDSCRGDEEYWYERTPYRQVLYSTCEGGRRLDRGTQHLCPGIRGHSALFWLFVLFFPFGLTALVAWWWYKKSGLARGTIRLPGTDYPSLAYRSRSGSGALDTLASVPWFLLGLAGIAWEYVSSSLESASLGFRSRRGYRDVPVDEDAQILRFEDEE
ncbi:Oligoxyloglucan reducing end-specific cellobiohydrolase [Leucogyrophana mollusca]|uniref:Oligoxyloglucan reducing end-specific cellobiohydrolase n=1 Tax=Leucogyrophana mollusca TaxID=85980 RepID=A0ACB8BDA5_9AGAM|nr:Oligoxyloglucan reducing end-specific cellobiohydrolase [Leucogyrophana mollusca]